MTTTRQIRARLLKSVRDMRATEIEFMEALCRIAKRKGETFDRSRIERLKHLSDDQLLQWAHGDLMA